MVNKEADDYSTKELLSICGADNGWAADELELRFNQLRDTCFQHSVLCNHLTIERSGFSKYILGRWLISDEPLRADAKRLLERTGDILLRTH